MSRPRRPSRLTPFGLLFVISLVSWIATAAKAPPAAAQCTPVITGQSPADGADVSAGQALLSWTSNPLNGFYDLQVSTSSSFTSPIINETYLPHIYMASDPYYHYGATLPGSGTYWWRARARCNSEVGSWSSPRSFDYTFVAPQAISNLEAVNCSMYGIQLRWTEPYYTEGGAAQEYEIRYSKSPITDGNWSSASPASEPVPANPGQHITHWVNGLNPCTWYYFAVRWKNHGYDEYPVRTAVWSTISNNTLSRTKCTSYGACMIEASADESRPEPTATSLAFGIRHAGPNPATQSIAIEYSLPADLASVDLSVFDISGRRVASLVHGPGRAGPASAIWNLMDAHGSRVRSGVYFVRLRSGMNVRSRMLVVR